MNLIALEKIQTIKSYEDAIKKGLISQIPYFGSILVEIYNEAAAQKIEERLSFLEQQIKHLPSKEIMESFFKTDDGFDLLCSICRKCVQTRDKMKIGYYAQILEAVLIQDNPHAYVSKAEDFIGILSNLTVNDMIFFSFLCKAWKNKAIGENDLFEISTSGGSLSQFEQILHNKLIDQPELFNNRNSYLAKLSGVGILISLPGYGMAYQIAPIAQGFFKWLRHSQSATANT